MEVEDENVYGGDEAEVEGLIEGDRANRTGDRHPESPRTPRTRTQTQPPRGTSARILSYRATQPKHRHITTRLTAGSPRNDVQVDPSENRANTPENDMTESERRMARILGGELSILTREVTDDRGVTE